MWDFRVQVWGLGFFQCLGSSFLAAKRRPDVECKQKSTAWDTFEPVGQQAKIEQSALISCKTSYG